MYITRTIRLIITQKNDCQQADINKLITRKFKQRPATQAETRDCAAPIGREELAKVLRSAWKYQRPIRTFRTARWGDMTASCLGIGAAF